MPYYPTPYAGSGSYPNYTGASFASSGGLTPALSQFNQNFGGGNLNVSAGSFGYNNVTGFPVPDFSSNIGLQNLVLQAQQKYIYSLPAGGYISQFDARNANSFYNKFGSGSGGDPNANAYMARLYRAVGNLPTRPIGTPALNQFYQRFGGSPALGPSYNQILGGMGRGAYQGPWQFGVRDQNYNPWGANYGGRGGPMVGTAW